MNPELEKQLEAEINRVLQGLPDLSAPPGLVARTMNALEAPARRHDRSWTTWPLPARIVSVMFALAAVAAACVGWRTVEPGLLAAASHHLAPAVTGLESFWNALSAVAGAVALAVEHLGTGFMLGCLVVAAGACALCAGLGTVFVRLALARPSRNSL